jgi:hypothetical protein
MMRRMDFDNVVQGWINVELEIHSKETQVNTNTGKRSYSDNEKIATMMKRRKRRRRTRMGMKKRMMILIPICSTTTNCRTALEGTQINLVWILT